MNLATRLSSDDPAFSELTVKQREVLELLAENRTTKEIAAQLGVSDSAVNQRIDPLRQRLGGVTRAELARRYRRFTQDAEAGDGCKVFTGEKLQVEIPAFSGQRVERDDRPGRYRFEDSLGFSHNLGSGGRSRGSFPGCSTAITPGSLEELRSCCYCC